MTQYEILLPNEKPIQYAHFGRRAAAFVIDSAANGIVFFLITSVIFYFGNQMGLGFKVNFGTGLTLSLIFHWIYYALPEAGPWQASPGKKMFGLFVTDMEYKPISFGRASIRHWAKLISTIALGTGFLGAAFTEQRQALHDIVADCLVLEEKKKQSSDEDDD